MCVCVCVSLCYHCLRDAGFPSTKGSSRHLNIYYHSKGTAELSQLLRGVKFEGFESHNGCHHLPKTSVDKKIACTK